MSTEEDKALVAEIVDAHGSANVRIYKVPDGFDVDYMGRGYFLIREGFLLVDEIQVEPEIVGDVLTFGIERVVEHIIDNVPLNESPNSTSECVEIGVDEILAWKRGEAAI